MTVRAPHLIWLNANLDRLRKPTVWKSVHLINHSKSSAYNFIKSKPQNIIDLLLIYHIVLESQKFGGCSNLMRIFKNREILVFCAKSGNNRQFPSNFASLVIQRRSNRNRDIRVCHCHRLTDARLNVPKPT